MNYTLYYLLDFEIEILPQKHIQKYLRQIIICYQDLQQAKEVLGGFTIKIIVVNSLYWQLNAIVLIILAFQVPLLEEKSCWKLEL